MRVFIFGIGGTGAKVLRSLTMLLASGVKFNHADLEIVPVIVDMDAPNGNTTKTRALLRSYYKIRKAFVNPTANAQSNTFFNTRLRPFNRLDVNAPDSADLDVQFDFQNRDNTFADFINFNGLSQVNKDVMELMYNDSLDDSPELYLNLKEGFKGNPNIGSVVFNDLVFSKQFQNLESSYTAMDRIFIVSSIFGGTGSSGFPTLTKLIRNSSNNHLAQTKIGAITVMPYYNVDSDVNSAINSAIFDTKTKAALSYYADDKDINSINALYYIADNNQSGSWPNIEGGKNQVTNGHLIELISATAIVDFIYKSDNELEAPQCFEFGAKSDANPFTIANFSSETKERCIKPLARFAYAAKIATEFIPTLTDNTFYKPKELDIANSLGIPNEYRTLLDFFETYKSWSAKEMSSSDNGRAFLSFNYKGEKNLNHLVHGRDIKTSWVYSGLSKKRVAEKLNRIVTKEPRDMPVPEKYLNMLYNTANECLSKLGQLP